MTQQQINDTYCGKYINEDRIAAAFHMMGKFGKCFIYEFAVDTDDCRISVEVSVEYGKIIGVVPEKEFRDDGWGIPNGEPGEILPEEYDRIAMYLDSVLDR